MRQTGKIPSRVSSAMGLGIFLTTLTAYAANHVHIKLDNEPHAQLLSEVNLNPSIKASALSFDRGGKAFTKAVSNNKSFDIDTRRTGDKKVFEVENKTSKINEKLDRLVSRKKEVIERSKSTIVINPPIEKQVKNYTISKKSEDKVEPKPVAQTKIEKPLIEIKPLPKNTVPLDFVPPKNRVSKTQVQEPITVEIKQEKAKPTNKKTETSIEESTVEIPKVKKNEISVVQQPKKDIKKPTPAPKIEVSSTTDVSYWVYPGEPACDAFAELEKLERVQEVKPEFFTIDTDGNARILYEEEVGCNGYSAKNVKFYKTFSDRQFITVSASGEKFSNLMDSPKKQQKAIEMFTQMLQDTGMNGIELDFEGYSMWTDKEYQKYLDFVIDLGNRLHGINKKLMIDAPAIYNDNIQAAFEFKYSDFNKLPVDYLTIMAYDYQYDYGGGAAVTDDDFLKATIKRAKREINDHNKIIIGLPTYGYQATKGQYDITILTGRQVFNKFGADKITQAKRIANSQELMIEEGNQVFVFQDPQSIQHKIAITKNLGISKVSIWHLGGNTKINPTN